MADDQVRSEPYTERPIRGACFVAGRSRRRCHVLHAALISKPPIAYTRLLAVSLDKDPSDVTLTHACIADRPRPHRAT